MADAPKKPVNPANKAAAAKKGDEKPHLVEPHARQDAIELIRLRNDFYRDNYRRLIVVLLLLIVFGLGLLYWIYYLSTHRPQPRYFATNVAGGLVPLVPLNQASLSDVELQNWATRAASAAFTFNYAQLRQQLQSVENTYFTETGAENYIQALTNSKDLDAVTQGRFIVTAQPTAAPVILSRGPMNGGPYAGHYAWVVSLPLQVNFQSDSLNRTGQRNVEVQLTIVRTSYMVDPQATNIDGLRGIGVNQLLVQGLPNNAGGGMVPNASQATTPATNPAV